MIEVAGWADGARSSDDGGRGADAGVTLLMTAAKRCIQPSRGTERDKERL